MANDTLNYCIVCSELTLFTEYVCLDKFDALFLLRLILEFPQNSELVYQTQSPSNSLPICEPCSNTVKQCKKIYTEISAQIQKFRGYQNSISRKILNDVPFCPHQSYKYNSWVEHCRQLVKNHNVDENKYPFVFHDPTKLLQSFQGAYHHQLTDYSIVTTGISTEIPIQIAGTIGYTFRKESLEISSLEDPLELQNEYNDDKDKNNDTSDKYESSEEDDIPPQPQFYYNRTLRQFHCSVPSCTTVNKVKLNIERHFRKDHSRTFSKKPKMSYSCSWPSCGKIFKKKNNHQSHISKHRGTPGLKCDKCGQRFYYRRGLRFHQSQNNCQPIQITDFVKNVHPNNDSGEFGYSIGQTLNQQAVPQLPINCTELTCAITSDVSLNVKETIEHLNYCENGNQSNHYADIPSTSFSNSSAIEVSEPFIAETDKLILKEEPQFIVEDDNCISNDSDENLELSEDNDCSDDDDDDDETSMAREHPTSVTLNKTDNNSDGYTCCWPGCGRRLCDKSSYSCHMDRHRATPKQRCEQCGHLFYSGHDLLNHQKMEHLEQKEIKQKTGIFCTWPGCGKRISSKTNWRAHMDQHKGTPQWKCEHCSHQCYWRSDLVKHVRAKHGVNITKYERGSKVKKVPKFSLDAITGEYKCLEKSCSKTSKLKQMIEDHYKEDHLKIKVKRGFVCEFDECDGRTFSKRAYWQAHTDKHKGTPQFKCEECNLLFYWKQNLVAHRRKQGHGNPDS